jgi:uncharacterized YigZ family protein
MMPIFAQKNTKMISETLLVPARKIETEFVDHNSRFITNAGPAFSVEEAQDFINHVKKRYPDASHHVPLYLIGHGASTIAHCSDAGEPSGTAGRPALAVLKGSGLGDVVAVITRYFGGTKLGTGGLVRAYSDSVRMMLEAMPIARKVTTTTVMFVVPYALYEQSILFIHHHGGKVQDEAFGVDVTLTVMVADQYLEDFKNQMVSLTKGAVEFITLAHNHNTILPLSN